MEQEAKDVLPERDSCVYTQYYCEENVWKLCEHVKNKTPTKLNNLYAVFISNHHKAIPLWQQKASKEPHKPVVWDYHVICVYKVEDGEAVVYDLDSRLSFPCLFNEYVAKAIQPDELLKAEFHRLFRVVPASLYLETFASDRSHMLREDKSWCAPPPNYPCICTSETKNNLQNFISMDDKVGVGYVMDTRGFANYFGCSREMVIQFLEYNKQEEKDSDRKLSADQQPLVVGECNGEKVIHSEIE